MLKRLVLGTALGIGGISGLLFAADGATDKIEATETVKGAGADASVVTQEVEDLATRLAARAEEQGPMTPQQEAGYRSVMQLLRKGVELQQRMFAALPEDLRHQIERFFVDYADFVARIHAPHAVYKLGIEIQELLEKNISEDTPESIILLHTSLKRSMEALRAGHWGEMFDAMNERSKTDVRNMLGDVFAGTVLGGANPMMAMTMGMGMAQPSEELEGEIYYDMQDLQGLVVALNGAAADFKRLYPENMAFEHFRQYITAIGNEDVQELARVSFVYLEPIYASVSRNLTIIQQRLYVLFQESIGSKSSSAPSISEGAQIDRAAAEQTIKAIGDLLEMDEAKALYSSNPYFYWLNSLSRHEGSCTAYGFIKRRFKQQPVGKEYFQLFRLFAHAYDFSARCLDIYKSEVRREAKRGGRESHWYDTNRLMPTLLNYALTSTVAANYFFKVQEVARNSLYHDVLMSKGAVSDIRTQMRAFVADYIGLIVAAPTALGMPLKGITVKNLLTQKAEELGAAWVYYFVFYNGLFNRNAFFRGPGGQPDAGTWSFWPAEFGVFKKALFGMIDHSVEFISLVAEASAYNYLDPDLMEDMEVASLGVVNPGAIRYVFKAFLPMLLLSPAGALLRLSPQDVGKHYALPSQARAAALGMSPAALYAEKTLVKYACGAAGYNLGYWVGNRTHEKILSGASFAMHGLLKLGDKVGIGLGDSQQLLKVLQFTALQLAETGIDYIKLFLWPTPEMEQMMEPFVRAYLLEHGYLRVDHDKNAYREAVVNMVLTRLAIQGLIQHYDAAVYAREFKTNPTMETVDLICRKIAHDLKKHIVCMGAGKLGEWIAEHFGAKAYDDYGPITPRVRALFA